MAREAMRLSSSEIEGIIALELQEEGYELDQSVYGELVQYVVANEQGKIAFIETSPSNRLVAKPAVESPVEDYAWRRAEAIRLEKKIYGRIIRRQSQNETIKLGTMRSRQGKELGLDNPEAARRAMEELELLRRGTEGGDFIELNYDGSVEDAEGYIERWVLEQVSLRDITGLAHVSTQMERYPMISWDGTETIPAGVVSINGQFPGGRWYFFERLKEAPRLLAAVDMLRVSHKRALLKCYVSSEEGARIIGALKAQLDNSMLLISKQQGDAVKTVPAGLSGNITSLVPVSLNSTAGPYEPGQIYLVPEDAARRLIQADADIDAAKKLSSLSEGRLESEPHVSTTQQDAELDEAGLIESHENKTGGYGIRMSTVDKIESLMDTRLSDAGKRRTTRQQAYGKEAIDYATVRKYVPNIHKKWDDWESGWEQNWEELVGWDEIKSNAN